MKRGTGLPQLLASILILLIGMFLLAMVFFFRAGDAPVTENVESELADFKAYYVLNGFLNQKMKIDDFYLDDPRVRDVIIAFEGLSQEEVAFNERLSLGLEAYNEVPDLFESLEFTDFEVLINDKPMRRTADDVGGFELGCGDVAEASTILSKKGITTGNKNPKTENVKVTLRICGVAR